MIGRILTLLDVLGRLDLFRQVGEDGQEVRERMSRVSRERFFGQSLDVCNRPVSVNIILLTNRGWYIQEVTLLVKSSTRETPVKTPSYGFLSPVAPPPAGKFSLTAGSWVERYLSRERAG